MADDLAERLLRMRGASGAAPGAGPMPAVPQDNSLEGRLARMQGRAPQSLNPDAAPMSGTRAFGRAGATTFVDNMMALPDVAVNMLREGGQMPPGLTRMFNPMENVRDIKALFGGTDAMADRRGAVAADDAAFYGREQNLGERNLGLPRGEQVMAAALAVPGGPGGLTDRYQAEMARGQQLRENHPIASTVGDVAGDAATLFTGRAPGVNAINRVEKAIAGLKNTVADPGVRRAVMDVMTSDAMKVMYRGAGRVAQTSLESASLALLKDGDPLDAALYGAGAQLAGSTALTVAKPVLKAPLWASVLAGGAVWQVMAESTPGGRDRILESLETGASGVAHTLMIAALAGGVGTGRMKSADIPKIADAFSTIPRGAMLSLITDMTKEEETGGSDVRSTMAHLVSNATAFNKTQITQIERAIEEGTLGTTIGKMVKSDPRFRALIDTDPQAAAAEADATRAADERRRELRKRLDERQAK